MNPGKYSKLPIDPILIELYRQGPNPDFSLPPTAAKMLDMLALSLTPQSPQVTLDAANYARVCGYSSQAALQKQVRKDLEVLTSLSLPAGDRGVRCPLLTGIQSPGGKLTVTFSQLVTHRLTHCPCVDFPTALLAIDARKSNSYFLGRRLAEFGAAAHTVPAGLLLESCPYIPSPDDFEGSRSILKRKVVEVFDASMNALQSAGIITWRYKTCDTSSYQAFEDSVVEFQLTDHPLRQASARERRPIHIDMTPYLKEGEIFKRTLIF